MATSVIPLGKEFKTPGYAERKARAIDAATEISARVVADAEGEERALPVLLNGKGLPDLEPYREEPWHRHAAMCYAMGMTAKNIAEDCKKSLPAVYKLIRRKEFQANVTSLVETHGVGDIMANFRSEVIASLATLVEIRDDEKAPKAVRANIAFGILERVLGKAVQKVEHSGQVSSDPVAEVERLEAQNQLARKELFGASAA